MGLKYVKRPRLQDLPAIPDITLASIGANNLQYEKYDEQVIFDQINKQLDLVQKRINGT
jgi:hypothetical protein